MKCRILLRMVWYSIRKRKYSLAQKNFELTYFYGLDSDHFTKIDVLNLGNFTSKPLQLFYVEE